MGISSATVTPASLDADASGNVNIVFTTANDIPVDGVVRVIFPTGFDLATGTPAVTAAGNLGANLAASVSGQTLILTRSDNGVFSAGASGTVTVSNIGNPDVTGATGTFTITTTTATPADINTLPTVAAVTVTAGAISSATVTPASLVAGASGNVNIVFTT